ncbi:hypothetical protein TPHA_0A03960 [Tetrapisispora phaffii CBS 4417]|uniref:Amino acid permease/ SLC12A domain-containing protein n=1 Tax=Tetrapisispora phaffii (strain ATCC 24235 / CBS 4417 / NBRC 1672 / NRRL Y-8282 / UCD 70-5) TaxID=1071381 RepID=G8BNJ4_TETPH|nr:hypothetical protein TPHA_0A03960 [Tetrapisispora phaffii CBS 4417]CCE61472.1 hypothetical protein TPHA_0A03960 [Tetrapisispora phaffii CBS 4417]
MSDKNSDINISETSLINKATSSSNNLTERIHTSTTNDYINEKLGSVEEVSSFDYVQEAAKTGRFRRWADSFKRAEKSTEAEDGESGSIYNGNESTELKKAMKSRHVVMMSLGTGIGTGLLVANAKGLAISGPAPLVIGYGLVSFITYFMIQAAGELGVTYASLPGNFNVYFGTLVSRPFGFATVWLASVQWLTVIPLELITCAITIKYWTEKVNGDIFVLIIYVFLLFIHIFGVKAYGEAEFLFNTCKILMIAGFIILSIVINVGGAGNDGYIGGSYWNNPGAFASDNAASRFKSICYILVTGYFSYGGTELFVLSVNEQENPRKSTPQAAKHSIYRILVIYLLTMILIGFNVPHDSDQLMGSAGSSAHASPYVLAASLHGVKVVPHFINAVILIALISVANSSLYAAPRMMVSLAQQGFAPKFLTYVDREGRPLLGIAVCAVFGVIGFAASSDKEEDVFTWLAAIAGLSELFTWSAFFLSHIRFRQAMKVQGKNIKECGYLSVTGIWGSIIGLCFNILVFIAQFWVALSPIGNDGKCDAQAFFQSYLAFPIWLAFYFGCMFYYKDYTLLNPLESIDLDDHRRIYDPEELKKEDLATKAELKRRGFHAQLVAFFC